MNDARRSSPTLRILNADGTPNRDAERLRPAEPPAPADPLGDYDARIRKDMMLAILARLWATDRDGEPADPAGFDLDSLGFTSGQIADHYAAALTEARERYTAARREPL